MCQHRRQRDHRTRGTSMCQLPVHLVGDGALLQHYDDMTGPLGERRHMKIHLAIAAYPRRAQIDLVLIDRRTAAAHLIDQRQQWTAERHKFLQRLTPQKLSRNLEERFRGHIRIDDLAVRRDQQHRIGQGIEYGIAVGRHRPAVFCG